MSNCSAFNNAGIKTLKLRSDDAFSKFCETNLQEAKRLETKNPVLPRNKQRPIRHAIRNAPTEFSDVETNYRQIYFEALDTEISCITSRFNQNDYSKYYGKIESLLLSAANSNEFQQDFSVYVTFMATTSTDAI